MKCGVQTGDLRNASSGSPARIAAIRSMIEKEGIAYILSEPQVNQGLIASVARGTNANMGIKDPIGTTLIPGTNLYLELMRNIANGLKTCL